MRGDWVLCPGVAIGGGVMLEAEMRSNLAPDTERATADRSAGGAEETQRLWLTDLQAAQKKP